VSTGGHVNTGGQGRLAWRCRRGMKELDLVLERWLARYYASASEAERQAFAEFLELPDPELARYLLGGERPEHGAFAAICAQLARTAP
jgi:antitoxin CptB